MGSITDSPMLTWDDSISPVTSPELQMDVQAVDNLMVINSIQADYSFEQVSRSVAASVVDSFTKPNPWMDNTSFFPYLELKMLALSAGKILLIEVAQEDSYRRVSRRISCQFNPSGLNTVTSLQESVDHSGPLLLGPPALSEGQQINGANGPFILDLADDNPSPLVTTQVRRSPRTNKYDGFKPQNFSDTKAAKSKVKARVVPSALVGSVKKQSGASTSASDAARVPATPIPELQAIGVNLCGVPPEELSPMKLLAPLQEDDAEDSA